MNFKLWLENSNVISVAFIINYIIHNHKEQLHQDYIEYLNSFKYFILKDVPINSLKLDLPMLDKNKVNQYKSMDFTKSPPIVVDGEGTIIDGYHRANAVKAAGLPTIKSYVGVE